MTKIEKLIELAEKDRLSLVEWEPRSGVNCIICRHDILPILRAAEKMAEALKEASEYADCDDVNGQAGCIAKEALAEWEKVNE